MGNGRIARWMRNIGCAALFAALAAAALAIHGTRMARPSVKAQTEPGAPVPRQPLFDALSPEAVASAYAELASVGSRAPGQPGLDASRDWLLKQFREAGLETYVQDVSIPYPLLDNGSGWVSNATFAARAWPLLPNYVQPVSTGPNGVEGELFLADSHSMRSCEDFSGKIAVIDTGGDIFADFGLNPARYANLGFKAIIYTHRDGLAAADWRVLGIRAAMRNLPVNIVRLACEPDILDHCGERVTVHATARWRNCRAQNVVGLLRAPNSGGRALFVPVTYDAFSALPDLAPGAIEAYQAAILAQAAKAFAAVRGNLQRDIVFAATAGMSQQSLGANRLLSTVGIMDHREAPAARIAKEIGENEERLAIAETLLAAISKADSPETLTSAIHALPRKTQKHLAERFGAVMRELVFTQSDELLEARIAYQRNPGDTDSPEYRDFRKKSAANERLNALSGMPLSRVVTENEPAIIDAAREMLGADAPFNSVFDAVKAALDHHLAHLIRHHKERRDSLERDLALQKLFSDYSAICAFSPRLVPLDGSAPEKLGVTCCSDGGNFEVLDLFAKLARDSIHELGMDGEIALDTARQGGYAQFFDLLPDSHAFVVSAYPAASLVSAVWQKNSSSAPVAPAFFANPASAPTSGLKVFAEAMARLAESSSQLPRCGMRTALAMRGSVFAAGIGRSIVPNFAVDGALVCSKDKKPYLFTNPYGEYDMPFMVIPSSEWEVWNPHDAFLFDKSGIAAYAKDYGASAQMLYASNMVSFDYTPINLVLYRAAPVALLDNINPQSLKPFSSCAFIGARNLGPFASDCPYSSADGFMNFVPPEERFFVTLRSGAPDNELVAVTREFCLGTAATNSPSWKAAGVEIEGPGYLAADTPILRGGTMEAIASMEWLNDKRLALQRRYGMSDELTETFAEKASAIASDAIQGAGAPQGGKSALHTLRSARQALAYLILNHPSIRGTITEAVFCIVWYLGLLVPFAFFFEKLLFAFTDARKQILAQGAIFLAAFGLLRLLHPAFHMIRSSIMILLGFTIVIIVATVVTLLSDKFQENVKALRQSQGHISGATGNKSGIVLTAFMLGLNNMHRRRIRTGLTCATLVLMTFVMVCFTSVQSNIVDVERATGRSPYQGIVMRNSDFTPITDPEIDALRSEFGENHAVSRRTMVTGVYDSSRQALIGAELKIIAGNGESSRQRTARGALGFDPEEPLASEISLLCTNGWFTKAQASATGVAALPQAMISDVMAAHLEITPRDVEQEEAVVTISGTRFQVKNIFDPESLATATDADGHDLLPFDTEALASTRFGASGHLLADDSAPRIPASEVVLFLNGALHTDGRAMRTSSAVIDMGNTPYAAARAEIVSYMERSGHECRYALDGTAFTGQRARKRSAAGYLELLIPLVIAALTVLNTMKGSVYERQGEIYVYNALGIAPRYVFFIFMAESMVYAVVGCVLGYIFSLAAGRLLAISGFAIGGMNFTTASCVHASLAIAAATLLSTWYPAHTAMAIAKPTDDAGWQIPSPDENGRLSFLLPFTFSRFDRIAVLAFFERYFDGYGEGSAGPFFAAEPELKISERLDSLDGDAYIPAIEVKVWLKPFDLGVSQLLEIELATDPETKDYIARLTLTRLSGTRDAWMRLNKSFITDVRRRFLHWRAAGPAIKKTLYAEASATLRRRYANIIQQP